MHIFQLTTRDPISHQNDSNSESASKHTCSIEDTNGPVIVSFVGNLTYHQFAVVLSGSCAILSASIVCTLIAFHAINYTNPVQQRQIIRIVLLVPWVALFSFLIVWHDDAGVYLVGSLSFGCSMALSSFLLLMCDFVLAHRGGLDDLFGPGTSSEHASNGTSPFWLKNCWWGILQFIMTSIIMWIATAVSHAYEKYCTQSNDVHFAHLWITIIEGYVTTIALINSLRFYKKNKAKLLQHKILLKLFTFKGVVGLHFLQSVLPLFFAVLLLFAFPPTPYKNQGGPVAGPLSAIVDALNVSDLLSAFVRGPMKLVREQQRQILSQNSTRLLDGDGVEVDRRAKEACVSATV